MDEVLKYFGAKSSSSWDLFCSCWLLSFDKGLQFISIGLDEESLLLLFLLDFLDLDFLGGLLYLDLDFDFDLEWDLPSFELLLFSFLSFSDCFSFDEDLLNSLLLSFSFSLISFSFLSDLIVILLSIFSTIKYLSLFSSFF